MRRLITAGLDDAGGSRIRRDPGGVSPAAGLVFGRRLQPAFGRLPRRRTTCWSTTSTFSPSGSATSAVRSFGGEYLTALGDNFDAGLGVGYYQRTVPTVYTDFVNANGTEIEQDLKLRIVPFTATVRWLPMGHHNGVEPYIGAGVGVFNYRYSETRAVPRDRQLDLPRQLRRQRHRDRAGDSRRRARAGRVVGRRRRAALSVGDGQPAGGPGLLRQQDRSRRLHLHVHDQIQILSTAVQGSGLRASGSEPSP